MTQSTDDIRTIRRPRLLVRAARFGLAHYARERDLKRLFGTVSPPRPGHALQPLIEQEAAIEKDRRTGMGGYSIARHIEVLTALMAESRLAPASLS